MILISLLQMINLGMEMSRKTFEHAIALTSSFIRSLISIKLPGMTSSILKTKSIYMCIHLAIQNSVISFASSTSPISSKSCVVPLTALSSAEKIQA
jgi:hypothetical protein